ncbi:hypothetical protein [Brasilonema octagenarum]|nr:hypothetical protein [Brasilonema octagenarum]
MKPLSITAGVSTTEIVRRLRDSEDAQIIRLPEPVTELRKAG